jgi:hypothetical protein
MKLIEDVALGGADGPAHADFPLAQGHTDQHNVHDDDAADDYEMALTRMKTPKNAPLILRHKAM